MSETKKQAQIELAMRKLEEKHEKQRNSLYEFLKFYRKEEKNEELDENWHIKELCDKLEAVYRWDTKRLMINVPPRTLKTQIASIAFPAWCMGKDASKQFMDISYASWVAEDNSRDCRNMYTSKAFRLCFPRAAAILKDQDTKKYWKNEDWWHYYASGSTGTITGKGCDIMVIDDPLKPDEAMSETVRPRVNNNFHDTLKSRLNSKTDGAIVIIMQRLHNDDLCGHLLEQERKGKGEKWEKLVISAIATRDDKKRKIGESFFKKRFPIDILMQLKKEKPITFSCQYQQNPVSKETQEFHEEWFRYHWGENKQKPAWLRIFTTCDPAFKKWQENDNTCIMTWGFDGDTMYILEYSVGKWSADKMIDKIIYHIRKYKPEKVGIEAFQAQSMIITFLKKKLQELSLHANIEEIRQTGDKLSKIRKLVPMYRDWLIYHTENMIELEEELKAFPRGKHDDMIDAEQMLYDLYTIQPNSWWYTDNIEMDWDEYWRPIINTFNNDWL